MAAPGRRETLLEILNDVLREPLPRRWPEDRPLVEAGLDSVAVLRIVDELERRFELSLGPRDLAAENFRSVSVLEALLERKGIGP